MVKVYRKTQSLSLSNKKILLSTTSSGSGQFKLSMPELDSILSVEVPD